MSTCRECRRQTYCYAHDCDKYAELICEYGHKANDYYCSPCFEDRRTELHERGDELFTQSSNIRQQGYTIQNLEKQVALNEERLMTMKILEEKVVFLGKWSFVPWEESANSETGDVTLVTSDGTQFLAHGLILSNRSDVFRAMLKVDMKEKESRQVQIKEVGGESLKAFLRFLYSAQLSDEDMHANYKELVKLGHMYRVKLLVSTLDKFISKHVPKRDTIVEAVKMGYLYDLEETRRAAQNLIAQDANTELLDIVVEELRKDDPEMASQLYKDIITRLKVAAQANKQAMDVETFT